MVAVTTLSSSGSYTYADLEQMPDDGHRYELLDGTLLVSPAPVPLHQTVVLRLAHLLEDAQAPGLQTFVAPLDVVLADDTVLQPDVLVAHRSDVAARNLPAPPVLAVEVLSLSTQRIDRFLKHNRYAAAGVAHYWVVDPYEPSLVAYEIGAGGAYIEVAKVADDQTYAATLPFDVGVTPSALIAA